MGRADGAGGTGGEDGLFRAALAEGFNGALGKDLGALFGATLPPVATFAAFASLGALAETFDEGFAVVADGLLEALAVDLATGLAGAFGATAGRREPAAAVLDDLKDVRDAVLPETLTEVLPEVLPEAARTAMRPAALGFEAVLPVLAVFAAVLLCAGLLKRDSGGVPKRAQVQVGEGRRIPTASPQDLHPPSRERGL